MYLYKKTLWRFFFVCFGAIQYFINKQENRTLKENNCLHYVRKFII